MTASSPTLMGKEQELRGDAKLVWDAVERHIEASAVDGISAGGEFSRDVQIGQQKYVDGLRVGRLAAINAIGRSSSDEAEVVGLPAIERYSQFVDGWGDEVLGLKQHPKGEYVKFDDVAALLASPSTEAAVATAMLDAWNDICSDTGCHPLDIAQLGRGKLAFSPQHWAKSTAMHLTAALVEVGWAWELRTTFKVGADGERVWDWDPQITKWKPTEDDPDVRNLRPVYTTLPTPPIQGDAK